MTDLNTALRGHRILITVAIISELVVIALVATLIYLLVTG